jgi:hypothetical protein
VEASEIDSSYANVERAGTERVGRYSRGVIAPGSLWLKRHGADAVVGAMRFVHPAKRDKHSTADARCRGEEETRGGWRGLCSEPATQYGRNDVRTKAMTAACPATRCDRDVPLSPAPVLKSPLYSF